MNAIDHAPAPVRPADRPATTHSAALAAPIARRVLAEAVLLGVTADALLRRGSTGMGLPLWIALATLALAGLAWRARGRVPRDGALWLASAVLFSATVAWRDAGALQFAGTIATL